MINRVNKQFNRKIMALLLTTGMITQSFSVYATVSEFPTAGTSGIITDFKPLEDEVAHQTVPLGTSLNELTLPGYPNYSGGRTGS